MLPTFLVIGAPKAGTTSLHEYLASHPDVFMPERKELNFFITEIEGRHTGHWPLGRHWYEQRFATANSATAIGEASPYYAAHPTVPGVAGRINDMLPNARLIYLVRDPVKQMISHYSHLWRSGKEHLPPEVALTEHSIYLDCSSYADQIETFLQYSPRSEILVVISEQLRTDRDATLERIFDFVGVDPGWRDSSLAAEHNVAAVRRGAPRGPVRAAMSTNWWTPVASSVPEPAKRTLRRISHKAPVKETDLSPELKGQLREMVCDNIERLYPYVEDDRFDGWGIAQARG
jgi:Sulfotransferase family